MDLGDLNKVWEIKPLKKPAEDEARRILERVAKQVQPIMRKRKWRVKLLSEFCPVNPSLLGLNVGGGIEVKLRLRRPNRDWDFIPFEQVLDTMLHELCHIEHGPHNAVFYKLWDEIRRECEELLAKGITGTGQGFDAPGRRLGGFSRQPPLPSLRQTALGAAEKRARLGALLPSGPKRLGGDSEIMVALSPIQAAAMAAERRMQDDMWCGSGSHGVSCAVESTNGTSEHRAPKEPEERLKNSSVIPRGKISVLVDSCDSAKGGNNLGVGSSNIATETTSKRRSMGTSVSGASSSRCTIEDVENKAIWECSICTLFNQPLAPVCEACGAQQPKEAGSKFKTWSCKFCTLKNNIKLEKCLACGSWRYSYGPPVSTPGPNLGT